MSEYAERDPRDLGEHYIKHVSAMTGEGLHSKAAIAAELAYRDAEIERFRNEVRHTASRAQLLLEQQNHIISELEEVNEHLRAENAQLRSVALPNEQGKNHHGVDVAYFRKTINRELNRPLTFHTHAELARVFARLSVTADRSVIFEEEFQSLKPDSGGEDNEI